MLIKVATCLNYIRRCAFRSLAVTFGYPEVFTHKLQKNFGLVSKLYATDSFFENLTE